MVNVQDTGKHETDTPPKTLTLKWYKENTETEMDGWMKNIFQHKNLPQPRPWKTNKAIMRATNPLIVVSCIRNTKSPQVLRVPMSNVENIKFQPTLTSLLGHGQNLI